MKSQLAANRATMITGKRMSMKLPPPGEYRLTSFRMSVKQLLHNQIISGYRVKQVQRRSLPV
jgi:hypothetical protein